MSTMERIAAIWRAGRDELGWTVRGTIEDAAIVTGSAIALWIIGAPALAVIGAIAEQLVEAG